LQPALVERALEVRERGVAPARLGVAHEKEPFHRSLTAGGVVNAPARLSDLLRGAGLFVVLLARRLSLLAARVFVFAGAVRGADGAQGRERRAARDALAAFAFARAAYHVVERKSVDESAAAVDHGAGS